MSDLLGCRYRQVQRQRFPHAQPTAASRSRAVRAEEGRRKALALLPVKPQIGDRRSFLRIDAGDEFSTLEALAASANLITDAEFVVNGVRVHIDILMRTETGYVPVVISSHRVARPAVARTQEVIATRRLGLGTPNVAGWKLRNHAADTFRLALADRALTEFGLASGKGGAIGQDPELTFLMPTSRFHKGLDAALQAPQQTQPHRVKQCKSCRYWFDCEAQLKDRDDLSLFLSGDLGSKYTQRGITTVQELIDADLGEASTLARAWRLGTPVLRRRAVQAPRFDVEIDIDMEAYLDHGVYLWGTYDGTSYTPFVTWETLGGQAEARNFAAFWKWLTYRREEALRQQQSFAVFCYSNHGENHWLRTSARRFAGMPGIPDSREVDAFIASPQWIDVFRLVRTQLAGPEGLGLKIVAPAAGFHWEGDLDGEASVEAYRQAMNENNVEMREQLLRYNRDDCKATAVVRDWLSKGALDIPVLC